MIIQGPNGVQVVAPPRNPSAPPWNPYGSLVGNDPQLQAQDAQLNAQGVANQAGLTQTVQRLLAQYGEVPAGLRFAPGSVLGAAASDPVVARLAALATKGGVSTIAQLAQAYRQRTEMDNASLAGRGILHSGAYGQHANEDLRNYNIAQYQSRQQLLDAIQNAQSGYLGQQQSLVGKHVGLVNSTLGTVASGLLSGQVAPPARPPAAPHGARPPRVPPAPTPRAPAAPLRRTPTAMPPSYLTSGGAQ